MCGVTPYDTTHLGHARTFLVFDVLVRHLEAAGQRVRYVQNVTDIDESILQRAARDRESWRALARRQERSFLADMRTLGWRPPDVMPHATREIPAMRALARRLLRARHAYRLPGGGLYYDVGSFPRYGALSRLASGPDAEDPRRPGRHAARRCAQAPSSRFRALAPRARRADLCEPIRPGSTGMASRVLGDGATPSGIAARHSRRRSRSRLPASRGGAGPERGGVESAVRPVLGPRRTHAARRGEDVQVHRQHDLRARRAAPDAPGRASALPAGRALPPAVRPRRPTDGGRRTGWRALSGGRLDGAARKPGRLPCRAPPFGCSTRTWTPLRCCACLRELTEAGSPGALPLARHLGLRLGGRS